MVGRVRSLVGVSIRECARQLGISDTAIRKAIKAGRCEQLADGSVDVQAVRSGMSLTADPTRGGQRQAGVFGGVQTSTTVAPAEADLLDQPAAPDAAAATKPNALLDARTLSEQTRAEREQIELAKLKGLVAEIEPMSRAVHDAMVAARSELLSLPDRLTPLVTPEQDPAKVYSLVEVEVNRVCQTLQDKLQQMAREHAALVHA